MKKSNYKILIVDDDPSFHQQLRYDLRENYVFEGATTIEKMDKLLENNTFDIILLDLVLDSKTNEKIGLEILPRLIERYPAVPVVIVTNDEKTDSVVEAMKRGAKDYLRKNELDADLWDAKFRKYIEQKDTVAELQQTVREEKKKVEKLQQEVRHYQARGTYRQPPETPLLGISTQMEMVRKMLFSMAEDPEVSVLILGETGVGKSLAANFLHFNSPSRSNQAFKEIHIQQYTAELMSSNLFGHTKGAFTGAISDQTGLLQAVDKGIAFLDEIGDLNAQAQSMLLQFLESKIIRPLGSTKEIKLDVQVISATNKNLTEAIADKSFRSDLYFRIKRAKIEIPPLRERQEDILPLLVHFLNIEEHKIFHLMEQDVLDQLINYPWPGNVRELSDMVGDLKRKQRALGLPLITYACLPPEVAQPVLPVVSSNLQVAQQPVILNQTIPSSDSAVPRTALKTLEEQNAWNTLLHIHEAILKHPNDKAAVAVALGTKPDLVLYRLKTIHEKFPELYARYPLIHKAYKTIGR